MDRFSVIIYIYVFYISLYLSDISVSHLSLSLYIYIYMCVCVCVCQSVYTSYRCVCVCVCVCGVCVCVCVSYLLLSEDIHFYYFVLYICYIRVIWSNTRRRKKKQNTGIGFCPTLFSHMYFSEYRLIQGCLHPTWSRMKTAWSMVASYLSNKSCHLSAKNLRASGHCIRHFEAERSKTFTPFIQSFRFII